MDPIEKPLETLEASLLLLEAKKTLPKNAVSLLESAHMCLLNAELRKQPCWPLVQRFFSFSVIQMRTARNSQIQELALTGAKLSSRFDDSTFCVDYLLRKWPVGALPESSWITRLLGDVVMLQQSRDAAAKVSTLRATLHSGFNVSSLTPRCWRMCVVA
jgi:hypothetical protein